jgi:hypothetical protein
MSEWLHVWMLEFGEIHKSGNEKIPQFEFPPIRICATLNAYIAERLSCRIAGNVKIWDIVIQLAAAIDAKSIEC